MSRGTIFHGGRPHAPVVVQGGGGFGALFRGLASHVMPTLKQAAKAVGQQALSTGMQIAQDVAQGKSIKDSVKQRGMESANVMKQQAWDEVRSRLTGSPSKGKKRARSSSARGDAPPTKKRRRKKKKRDILD